MPTTVQPSPVMDDTPHTWTFEQLYTDHYTHVLTCVRAFGCSQEEAEDITQDTFLKALQALSTADTARSVFPWLYQIARNTAYDVLRRKHRAREKGAVEMPEDVAYYRSDGSDLEEEIVTRACVQSTLDAIPVRYRDALLLQASGYPCQDIATRFG